MPSDARASEILKQLVAVLVEVDHCRFCCVAADEECHKQAFDAALARAKKFIKEQRREALTKPS